MSTRQSVRPKERKIQHWFGDIPDRREAISDRREPYREYFNGMSQYDPDRVAGDEDETH